MTASRHCGSEMCIRDRYYVHSFYARDCAAGTLAASRYGNVDVTGVVRRGHVYGTQFHPEKSGDTGDVYKRQM